ncbi:hypothetical protein KC363_g379 [Hortaea werneckii]|nr:hypothetical protein KC325_g8037 [Hortaea werneckii]KAI6987235.1 hypothetical protein KC359_g8377 [Hortaea werneckii]KAI7081382.1 hypothetical protein KC356_g9151 [Hortaea werneckii]KAI7141354.1 hypothetical protein KC344_g8046 [Hortaea werneckii]KAI7179971.1 hypothetical protein KC360_g482 [Hortaea werneckii]
MADSADNPPTDADHFVDFSEFDFPEFRPINDGSAAEDDSVTPGLANQDPSHDTTGPSSAVSGQNDTGEPHRDSLMPAQSKKPGPDNSDIFPLGQSPSNSRSRRRGQTWQHDVPIRNSFPPKAESNEKQVKSKPALPPGLPPSSTTSWQQEIVSDSTKGPRQAPLQFIHDESRAIEIFNYDFKPLYNWLNSHPTPLNPFNLFIIMKTRPRDPTSPVPPSQHEADFKAGLTWLFLAASEHPALYTPGGTLELAFPALETAEPLVLSFPDTIRMRHNASRRRARHDRAAMWQEVSRPLGIAILFAQQMRSFGVGMGRVTNGDVRGRGWFRRFLDEKVRGVFGPLVLEGALVMRSESEFGEMEALGGGSKDGAKIRRWIVERCLGGLG